MSNARQRILFVDDEPSILGAIRLLLYKERKRWDMKFASGAEAALAELEAGGVDVVVSDMRMPGMDGATLLHRVRDRFPTIARIMLSGHADRESILRALPALHQLLSKPCEGVTLRTAIERGLGRASADAAIEAAIGRVSWLPSSPSVHVELVELARSPSAGIEQCAAVIRRDPALGAKVLQLVNSDYFGGGLVTSSIDRAVARLGVVQLRELVRTGGVFVSADTNTAAVAALQERAVRRSTLVARFLLDLPAREEGCAAALLLDAGGLLLLGGDLSSTTPTEVGGRLMELWGLPAPIIDIVRRSGQPDRASEELRLATAAVHVADALTTDESRIDLNAVEQAGAATHVTRWRELAQEHS